MKLVRHLGQQCTFRVCCDKSQQVSLVIDILPAMPQIISLHRVEDGVWETKLQLPAGRYRFCYHLYDGRSLQYLTPAGLKVDGLKAVLEVDGDAGFGPAGRVCPLSESAAAFDLADEAEVDDDASAAHPILPPRRMAS
ncbi:MAG: hypothetical protein WD118_01900 [Phycisphaeraceae bacterium]